MSLTRRALLLMPALAARQRDVWAQPRLQPGVPIALPRDFGAHPEFRTEWWYVTGRLDAAGISEPDRKSVV